MYNSIHMKYFRINKSIEQERKLMASRDWTIVRMRRDWFVGTQLSKNAFELNKGGGCTWWMHKISLDVYFKLCNFMLCELHLNKNMFFRTDLCSSPISKNSLLYVFEKVASHFGSKVWEQHITQGTWFCPVTELSMVPYVQ